MSSKTKTIVFILLLAVLLMIAVWLYFDWRIHRIKESPEQTTFLGKQVGMHWDWVKLQPGKDT